MMQSNNDLQFWSMQVLLKQSAARWNSLILGCNMHSNQMVKNMKCLPIYVYFLNIAFYLCFSLIYKGILALFPVQTIVDPRESTAWLAHISNPHISLFRIPYLQSPRQRKPDDSAVVQLTLPILLQETGKGSCTTYTSKTTDPSIQTHQTWYDLNHISWISSSSSS